MLNTKLANIQASVVWNIIALNIFLVLPNSLLIAPIAPKHGALNRLNTINAYALIGVKKLKADDLKIIELSCIPSLRPAIILIDDITCSFATNPCIAETAASQLNVPSIG